MYSIVHQRIAILKCFTFFSLECKYVWSEIVQFAKVRGMMLPKYKTHTHTHTHTYIYIYICRDRYPTSNEIADIIIYNVSIDGRCVGQINQENWNVEKTK